MRIFVTVKTNARETKVIAEDATHFAVSVTVAPIEGKANSAVIKALARHLGRAPSTLVLRSGGKGKRKVIEYE